jgi:hypothetical protein
MNAGEYLNSDIASHALFYATLSLAMGVLVAGWNSFATFVIVFIAYEVAVIYFFPKAYILHFIGALYYFLGYIIGNSLFPCNRHRIFKSCRFPWKF